MAVINVARDVKGHRKGCSTQAHDKKAREVYLIQVFRVQEEIRNAQVRSEASGDHGKQDDPAKQQNVIALCIVQEKLNRKRVSDNREKGMYPAHEQYL